MQRTRHCILEYLKQRGRATLEDLARETALAPMTVRGHLAVLERDNFITFEEERGKVGRPRFVYTLTEHGHDLFPKGYHTLCNRILDALHTDTEVTAALASRVAEQWAGEHTDRLQGKNFDQQVQTLAEIRTEEGAMASLERDQDGYILCQKHCPASCVAARHPDVICAAEIGFMSRVIDATVERITWMQRGDATCSYRIQPRKPANPAERPATPESVCRPAPAD